MYRAYMVEVSDSCKRELSRILYKTVDYLIEYTKRLCGFKNSNGRVNKLLAPHDINQASVGIVR